MEFLKWNDDMLVLLVGRQAGNTVIPTLDAYLKSLKLQERKCRDIESLKALCSTVQLHIPHVHNLVATKIKLSALCLQYRYCEDIAATFISIELNKISTSYCKENLAGSVIDELSDSCNSLLSILYQSLPWKYLNIINCLLKVRYNSMSPHSLYIVEHLSFNILFECSMIDREELTVCAAYLLYCKYKKLRPSYEHKHSLEKFMNRFNLNSDSFTEMQLLKDILQLKHGLNLNLTNSSEEPCGKKCTFIKNYFQYLQDNAKSLIMKARNIDPNVIDISDDEDDKTELDLMPLSDMQLEDNVQHVSIDTAVKIEDIGATPTTHNNGAMKTTVTFKSQINSSVPSNNENFKKTVVQNTESREQTSQITLTRSRPLGGGMKVRREIKIEPHNYEQITFTPEPFSLTLVSPNNEERVIRILDMESILAAEEEEKAIKRKITINHVPPPPVICSNDIKHIYIVDNDEKTENASPDTDSVPDSDNKSHDIISPSEQFCSKIMEQTSKEIKELVVNPTDCMKDKVDDVIKMPEIRSHSSSKDVELKEVSGDILNSNETKLKDIHTENKHSSTKHTKSCTSTDNKQISMDVVKEIMDVKATTKCHDKVPFKESDDMKVTTSHSKSKDSKEPLKVVPDRNKEPTDVCNKHNDTTTKRHHSHRERRSRESKDILTDENKLIKNKMAENSSPTETPKKLKAPKLTEHESDINKSRDVRLHADVNKDCDNGSLSKTNSHKSGETKQKVDRHERISKKSKESCEKEKPPVQAKESPSKRSRHSSETREKKAHHSNEEHHKKTIAHTSKENKENGECRSLYPASRDHKEKGKTAIKESPVKAATKSKDNKENGNDTKKTSSPKLKEYRNSKDKSSNKQHIDSGFLFKDIPFSIPQPDLTSPKKRSPGRSKESKDKDKMQFQTKVLDCANKEQDHAKVLNCTNKGQDYAKIMDCANRLVNISDTVAADDATPKKTSKHKSKESREKDHRSSSRRKTPERNKAKGKEENKPKDKHEHRAKTSNENKSRGKSEVKETEKTTTKQQETKSECTSPPKDVAYKFKKEIAKVSTYSRSENKTKLVTKNTESRKRSSESLADKDSISEIQNVVRSIMNDKEFSSAEHTTNTKSLSLVELHSILNDSTSTQEKKKVAEEILEEKLLAEPEENVHISNDIIIRQEEIVDSINEVIANVSAAPKKIVASSDNDSVNEVIAYVSAAPKSIVTSPDKDVKTIDNKTIEESVVIPRELPAPQTKFLNFSIENIVRESTHADIGNNKTATAVTCVEQQPITYDKIKENTVQVEQSVNARRYKNIRDVSLDRNSQTSQQYDHLKNTFVSDAIPEPKQIQLPNHNYEHEKHKFYNQQQPTKVRVSIPMSPNLSAYKIWDFETPLTNGFGLSQAETQSLNGCNGSFIECDPVNLTMAHNPRNVASTDKLTNGKSSAKSVAQTELKSSLKSDKIKPPRAISFSRELMIKQFDSDEVMPEILVPPRQSNGRKRQGSILSTDSAELSAKKPKTSRINDLRLDMDIDRAFALVDKQRDKSNNRRGVKRKAQPPNTPMNAPTYLSQPPNVQPILHNGITSSYSNVTPSGAYVASPPENARVVHSVSQFPETPSPEPCEILRTCFGEDEPLSETLQELRKYNYSESEIQLLWESMKTPHTQRLPFKKRYNTVPSSAGQTSQPEVSYPATPMISILELQRMPNAIPPAAMLQPTLTDHYSPPPQSQPNMLPYIFHVDNSQHAGMYYPQ